MKPTTFLAGIYVFLFLSGISHSDETRLPVGYQGARKSFGELLNDLRGVGSQIVESTGKPATHSITALLEGLTSLKFLYHAL
jgi:hypothetical protein